MSSYRWILRPTWMLRDRMIAPINVHSIPMLKIVYITWQQNFFHGHHGIMTNLVKLVRREQVERWTSTVHSGQAPEVHFQIFGFPWCSTSKNLSIDVSITKLGLMLTKLMWFKLCQKSKFKFPTFLKKKIKFLGFHGVVPVKTFPLMYQLLM